MNKSELYGAARDVMDDAMVRKQGSSEGADPLDLRFRALVGTGSWSLLPDAVQRRFSKRLMPGDVVLYRGHVLDTRLTFAGRLFAQAARVVGSPLPRRDKARGAAVVCVSEGAAGAGQVWTRTYCDGGNFPQVIHSEKRFSGPTGLEEYIGYGVGMNLSVCVEDRALVFRSTGYFWTPFSGVRLMIPKIMWPGQIEVVHREENADSFLFELSLVHPWFGLLVSQTARFVDVV